MIIESKQKEQGITVIWENLDEADGYTVYKKTSPHLYSSVKDTKNNIITLYGFAGNEDIKVKPYKTVNNEKTYPFKEFKIALGKNLQFTKFFILSYTERTKTTLIWHYIKNADNYVIYRDNLKVGKVTTNSFTEKYLPAGNSIYVIKAYNKQKLVAESEPYTVCINSMEMCGINTDNGILLYWNNIINADGYRLFKKNDLNEFAGFVTSDTNKISVTNFKPGETCEYKVKPFVFVSGHKEYTSYSAKCKINTSADKSIKVDIIEAYGGKMALSWRCNREADGFDIFDSQGLVEDIQDGLAHIYLTNLSDESYTIKSYKMCFSDKIYTAESEPCMLNNTRNFSPQKYKLSVVIPTYNAEEYLSRTICSVLCSTLDDIQLVLVDDGSQDATRDIINWYAEKYPKFIKKVFKKNSGIADTRNRGIKAATGKYLAFMDNDDLIRPNGFKRLYEAIEKTHTDIAIAPIYLVDNEFYNKRISLNFKENVAHNVEDYLKLFFSEHYSNVGVWNKLYKTKLVKAHPFGLLSYEDVSWTPYILSHAETFCYVDDVCYEWDRKIRTATYSSVLTNRSAKEKFEERLEAIKFFYENGNPKHSDCLVYLAAKRLYSQGIKAKYDEYFKTIIKLKSKLINNKFLLEDKYYSDLILPLISN